MGMVFGPSPFCIFNGRESRNGNGLDHLTLTLAAHKIKNGDTPWKGASPQDARYATQFHSALPPDTLQISG
jgi:hypothetical protein